MTTRDLPTNCLTLRVCGQCLELPDLQLTGGQAARLLELEASTCEVRLERPVVDQLLQRGRRGQYVRR
jgi:hypothetical protein